jgi:hypothetical protein
MHEESVPSGEESSVSPASTPEAPEPVLADPPEEKSEGTGALLDPEASEVLEAEDRKKPIPGGEPDCPRCGTRMTRKVERYPAPRGGSSPFRVRLVCPDGQCGVWTVYDW